jgi:hypothetical protein
MHAAIITFAILAGYVILFPATLFIFNHVSKSPSKPKIKKTSWAYVVQYMSEQGLAWYQIQEIFDELDIMFSLDHDQQIVNRPTDIKCLN